MTAHRFFYSDENTPHVFTHDIESLMVINISEYRSATMYSEPEVQVFLKQLEQLTKVQYVIKQEQ
jgi:hypothetical protein